MYQPGIMSLVEISNFLFSTGLQSTLLTYTMMKQITWSDQRIGYDDADTIALRKQFANNPFLLVLWPGVSILTLEREAVQIFPSTDGTCGLASGGTVCFDSGFGHRCSSSGWYGSIYYDTGCQRGDCYRPTTDGECGSVHNHRLYRLVRWNMLFCKQLLWKQ